MKITVIRHSTKNRGSDRLVLEYLSYLVRRGHEVTYWTNDIDTHFPVDPFIKLQRIPGSGVGATIFFTLTRKFDADIVLVDLVVMAFLSSILNGRQVVYFAQDDDRTYFSSLIIKSLIDGIYRLALSVFKVKVIAVSHYLAKRLGYFGGREIRIVANGINTEKFYCEDSPACASEKKTSMAVILYARADYRKGWDIGVKALEELARLRGVNDWELWVIGQDAVDIQLQALSIKRWGLLKDDDLRRVLSAADIFVSPSRHEGFGLMQLESMACGCVMVTTSAFALAEHEKNGLVCPVDDWKALARQLNRVMNDRPLCQKLKQNALKLAASYSLESSKSNFEGILAEYSK